MKEFRFPRTLHGWNALFWLSLHRCPIHHTPLRTDPWDLSQTGPDYCFKCEGIGMWPTGFTNALRQNAQAFDRQEAQRILAMSDEEIRASPTFEQDVELAKRAVKLAKARLTPSPSPREGS